MVPVNPQLPLLCKMCGRGFHWESQLNYHVRKKCEFATTSGFRESLPNFKRRKDEVPNITIHPELSLRKPYQCSKCVDCFQSHFLLQQHVYRQHTMLNSKSANVPKDTSRSDRVIVNGKPTLNSHKSLTKPGLNHSIQRPRSFGGNSDNVTIAASVNKTSLSNTSVLKLDASYPNKRPLNTRDNVTIAAIVPSSVTKASVTSNTSILKPDASYSSKRSLSARDNSLNVTIAANVPAYVNKASVTSNTSILKPDASYSSKRLQNVHDNSHGVTVSVIKPNLNSNSSAPPVENHSKRPQSTVNHHDAKRIKNVFKGFLCHVCRLHFRDFKELKRHLCASPAAKTNANGVSGDCETSVKESNILENLLKSHHSKLPKGITHLPDIAKSKRKEVINLSESDSEEDLSVVNQTVRHSVPDQTTNKNEEVVDLSESENEAESCRSNDARLEVEQAILNLSSYDVPELSTLNEPCTEILSDSSVKIAPVPNTNVKDDSSGIAVSLTRENESDIEVLSASEEEVETIILSESEPEVPTKNVKKAKVDSSLFKCDKCNFKTGYEKTLKLHKIVHE